MKEYHFNTKGDEVYRAMLKVQESVTEFLELKEKYKDEESIQDQGEWRNPFCTPTHSTNTEGAVLTHYDFKSEDIKARVNKWCNCGSSYSNVGPDDNPFKKA